MLTIWETFICIHDHHPELLPDPVHLLLVGKFKTLNTSVLINLYPLNLVLEGVSIENEGKGLYPTTYNGSTVCSFKDAKQY